MILKIFKHMDELEKIRQIRIHRVLNIKDTGRRIPIRCLFHNEKSPSCVIYPDNSYYCYGCGKHGNNSIDFVMDMGYSFKDAIEELKRYL